MAKRAPLSSTKTTKQKLNMDEPAEPKPETAPTGSAASFLSPTEKPENETPKSIFQRAVEASNKTVVDNTKKNVPIGLSTSVASDASFPN